MSSQIAQTTGHERLTIVRSQADPDTEPAAPVSERAVEALAHEIGQISREMLLGYVVSVGRLVVERIYDGQAHAWRSRGRKDASLRKLAERLEATETMSASSLYRCLAAFELVERLGGVSTLKHVGASHVYEVLPLAEEMQEEVLRRADREKWSVRRIETESARLRPAKAKRARARPRRDEVGTPRFVTEISSFGCYLREEGRFADLDRASEVALPVLRDLCGTLTSMARRCEELRCVLEEAAQQQAAGSPPKPRPRPRPRPR